MPKARKGAVATAVPVIRAPSIRSSFRSWSLRAPLLLNRATSLSRPGDTYETIINRKYTTVTPNTVSKSSRGTDARKLRRSKSARRILMPLRTVDPGSERAISSCSASILSRISALVQRFSASGSTAPYQAESTTAPGNASLSAPTIASSVTNIPSRRGWTSRTLPSGSGTLGLTNLSASPCQ